MDTKNNIITIDTEGLLGVSPNENQRTRLLLKVLAISGKTKTDTNCDAIKQNESVVEKFISCFLAVSIGVVFKLKFGENLMEIEQLVHKI